MTTTRAPRHPYRILPALSLTLALALTGCGSGEDSGTSESADAGSTTDAGGSGAVPAPSANGEAYAPTEDRPMPPIATPPIATPPGGFTDHGTSPLVETATDALSTFALDVDSGSFDIARSYLEQGLAVPPDSIRAEEWINAFDYDDPAPSQESLAVDSETGVRADGTQVVRVALTAREVVDRGPVNITLVVDRSGSMDEENKLPLVRSALTMMAEQLRDDDTVSVVSFDTGAELLLPPTPVSDRESLLGAVDRLQIGGSTNVEAGLRLGYEQARSAYVEGGTNVVVLCSDGVANTGSTGPDSITSTIAEEGARGINLVTVGFGMGGYNDHLMEQLADTGDGFYRYIDSAEQAEDVFVHDLATLLIPVAQEARAQVEFDPERVSAYRLIGYENRAMADEDFEDMTRDAGELGSGHHVTALYEVRPNEAYDQTGPDQSAAPGTQIGAATVRWTDPTDLTTRSVSAPILTATGEPSPAWRLAATVAEFAEVLKSGEPSPARLDALAEQAEELRVEGVAGGEELASMIARATQV